MKGVQTSGLLEVFAVANTPLFLLRKLKGHPFVTDIQKAAGTEILARLKQALIKKPKGLPDFAAPYIYLVAIAGKNDLPLLRGAAVLPAPNHDWFGIIANALVKTFNSTSIDNIQMPNTIPSSALSIQNSIPSRVSTLEIK